MDPALTHHQHTRRPGVRTMDRPILHTEMCDLLDIEYPIALAGMGPTVGGGTGRHRRT